MVARGRELFRRQTPDGFGIIPRRDHAYRSSLMDEATGSTHHSRRAKAALIVCYQRPPSNSGDVVGKVIGCKSSSTALWILADSAFIRKVG
ncbi:hypothetical protein CO656_28065 [Sinorhizobium sp. FG01]|uniref:Uncharacterized protein n=1 Tax=Sinorhizobium americanum TaxID=194963 RepID=A0A2S3YQ75_9HYPH|nr:hypothetical protein CO656_28065 [Sinorhizobium sp. FG01]POH33146.1 hypothetical protein ATY31_11370 [Sinorhizobium americanum]